MKNKSRKYDYGECEICDAKLVERRIKQDFWIRGKLVVIDNVPAGVWTHLSFTWRSGGDLVGYINGQEVGRIPASANPIVARLEQRSGPGGLPRHCKDPGLQ